MGSLNFILEPRIIPHGDVTRVVIQVGHDLPETLQKLNLRVKVSSHVQVIGPEKFEIGDVGAGETKSFAVPVQGQGPGLAEIRLERINGLRAGKSIDFPGVTLGFEVRALTTFPDNAPRLECRPVQLDQNAWGSLQLQLTNNSDCYVESTQLICHGSELLFEAEGQRDLQLALAPLAAYQSLPVTLRVKPLAKGDTRLGITFQGYASGQFVQRQVEFSFTVNPDLTPQVTHIQTGDIINLRGQVSVGGDVSSQITDLGKVAPTEGPMPTSPDSAPAPSLKLPCPACGQLIDADSVYCNYCQRPTGFPG